MLNLNKQLSFSEYEGIYEVVVPKEHFLCKIKEKIDFSFVNRLMAKCYSERMGRPAYEPEMMLKLLFLEMYYDLSDREMVRRAQTDMAIKMFLGIRGYDSGTFTSPYGLSYESRSLAPGTEYKPYSIFEVVEPFDVQSGYIAPWFDQPGGGIQYKMNMSIEELLKAGKIRRIN